MSLPGAPSPLDWSSKWREGNDTPDLSPWGRNTRLCRGHGKEAKWAAGTVPRDREVGKQVSQGGGGKTTPRVKHTHQGN